MEKIALHNKRRDYDKSLHKPFQFVPNTKCDAYSRIRKHDYALRSSWESTVRTGDTLFLLFTYSNQRVPRIYYKGNQTMCFDNTHIQTLLKALKDKFGSENFSWLIGSEYAVDERYSQRPHYHALFMLDKSIDSDEFTEFCRTVWTGKEYGSSNNKHAWRFGNLGFMFPSVDDCHARKHIARDKSATACYAAKYAVKQVGFYANKTVNQIVNDGFKSQYKNNFPRVFTSHHFGAAMETDKSFDLENGKVMNPLTNELTNIPQYNVSRCISLRWFDGDYRYSYTYERYCKVTKNSHVNGIAKVVALDSKGIPKVHRNYRYSLSTKGMLLRLKQLPQWISRYQMNIHHDLNINIALAYRCAVYHYVYKHLPIDIYTNILQPLGFEWSDLWSFDCYTTVYKWCSLFKGVKLPDGRRTLQEPCIPWVGAYDSIGTPSCLPADWTRKHLGIAMSLPENVVFYEDFYTTMLEDSSAILDAEKAEKDILCYLLLKNIKPEKFPEY